MNIKHAKKETVVGDNLITIFNRQKELMEKYHDIEARSGLLQTDIFPLNLDDKRSQARIKDFSWRVTEELGEALDAYYHEFHDDKYLHFIEELIDGLHFLVELTIQVDFSEEDISYTKEEGKYLSSIIEKAKEVSKELNLEETVVKFICYLGMMCNTLKNKPWKQSQMKTDKNEFYSLLKTVWLYYIVILDKAKLSEEGIVEIYLKKSQVNKFRQRSGY